MAEAPMSSLFLFPENLPNFVDINPKYLCLICHQTLNNPVQTECGHRMCRQCVQDRLASVENNGTLPCPGEGETCIMISKEKLQPDYPIRREMGKLKVYCTNEGCKKIMMWNDLKNHLKECPMSPVDCPNKMAGCKQRIALRELENHVRLECPYRKVNCGYCQLEMIGNELKAHINNYCPQVQIPCRFCSALVYRNSRHKHEERCDARPKNCSFGCDYQGTEEQLSEHDDRHVNAHLEKLSQRCDTQCLGYKEQIDSLRNEVEKINKESFSVREENRKLSESVKQAMKTIANQENKILGLEHKMEELERKVESNVRGQGRFQELLETNTRQLEAVASASGFSEEVRKQLIVYDRMTGAHEEKLTEMVTTLECLQNTSYNGTLFWKIGSYSSRKAEAASGRMPSMFSQPFYTDRFGYKMCARVYLNGDGLGKGTHMSLFFVLLKGEFDALQSWPFRQKVMFTLMDQDTGRRLHSDSFRPDPTSSSFKRPVEDMNVATGCPLFLPHSVIESKTYLKDDAIFIRIIVEPTDTKMFSS